MIDGNGGTLTQPSTATPDQPMGQDRYGNGLFSAHTGGLVTDWLETTNCLFHGVHVNGGYGARIKLLSHRNWDNGLVLTGRTDLGWIGFGNDHQVEAVVQYNGRSGPDQDDTSYLGAAIIAQINARFDIRSRGHSLRDATEPHGGTLGRTRTSGGALLMHDCYRCNVDLSSYDDYRALILHNNVQLSNRIRVHAHHCTYALEDRNPISRSSDPDGIHSSQDNHIIIHGTQCQAPIRVGHSDGWFQNNRVDIFAKQSGASQQGPGARSNVVAML